MISLKNPRVVFPVGHDARSEHEAALRGFLRGVLVESGAHDVYEVTFIDPVRLQQELEDESAAGRPFFTEPGLVVVQEVTREAIEDAVRRLWESHFFDRLQPLPSFDQSANAGNLGDVFKHACLIELFLQLASEEKAPLSYIESHSGYATYDLARLQTKKNGWLPERKLSLEPLLARDWHSAGLKKLKDIIQEKRVYPGSPALALWLLPPSARLYFYDVNPRAIESIKQEAARCGRTVFADTHPSDSMLTVQQELARPRGPGSGRVLGFLDPWYRQDHEQADWQEVVRVLETARARSAVLAWYPKKRAARKPFPPQAAYTQLRSLGASWAEIDFPGAKRLFSRFLGGCGLCWKGLPFMPALAEAVGTEMQQAFQEIKSGRTLGLQFQHS
jgi:23S rRNA A2030 N6-methylase RlmJ